MSDIIEIELNKVCRTCLNASEDMKSLYEASASVSETLADRLMSNTPLTCHSNDGLPTRMCRDCITDLNRMCTFKLKCRKSEEILQNYASYLHAFYKNNGAPPQPRCSPHNPPNLDQTTSNNKPITEHAHIFQITDLKNQIHHEIDLALENIYDNGHPPPKPPQKTVKPRAKRALVNGRPFLCTECNASFTRKDVLRTHMRTHTGNKPYACPVCTRAFRNKNNLTVHIRTHTGEKPYACTQCDRSFTHKSDVKKHTRVHTGEKPYTCTVCAKSFSYTHHLKNHMRSHTGAQPYACTDCNCAFSCAAGLKCHVMTHAQYINNATLTTH